MHREIKLGRSRVRGLYPEITLSLTKPGTPHPLPPISSTRSEQMLAYALLVIFPPDITPNHLSYLSPNCLQFVFVFLELEEMMAIHLPGAVSLGPPQNKEVNFFHESPLLQSIRSVWTVLPQEMRSHRTQRWPEPQ